MIPMNRLPVSKRAAILSMLCEGMSMRATSRLADVSINTVNKLLVDAGKVVSLLNKSPSVTRVGRNLPS